MSLSPAEYMARHFDEIVALTARLIGAQTVAAPAQPGCPFGPITAQALDEVLSLAESMGLRTGCLDHRVGWAECGEGADYVMIMAHLDVVPAGEGWTRPPFVGTVENGRLYGRGAGDNKSAVAAGLYALCALKQSGLPLTHRVRLVLGCDEETGMTDIERYFADQPLPVFGFIPDSEYPLVNREKGIAGADFRCPRVPGGVLTEFYGGTAGNVVPPSAEALLQTQRVSASCRSRLASLPGITLTEQGELLRVCAAGRAAHASLPHLGDNALRKLAAALLEAKLPLDEDEARFLHLLRDVLAPLDGSGIGIAGQDAHSTLTCNLGMAHSEPQAFFANINVRYPVTWKGGDLQRLLKDNAAALGSELTAFEDSAPLNVSGEDPYVKRLQRVYTACTGREAQLLCIGGGTYARKCRGRCVGFGGIGETEHMPDEFIELEEFRLHARIMAQGLAEIAR